jgi:polynucleotide 5'-hydroxyl-kinase GRC3/NOL9
VSKDLRRLALEQWVPQIRSLLHCQRTTVPKILVSGAKGTGKSTFCRVLINSMLTTSAKGPVGAMKAPPEGVIFLDIDPGQPEFAAPGVVYLAHVRAPIFGPSFTNLIVPGATENVLLRMHYIGVTTPRESPLHYLKCVRNLLSLYRIYENIPLVINTCGLTTGAGKAILVAAVGELALTDIVHMGDTRNSAVNHLMQTKVGREPRTLTQIPAQSYATPLRSSRDLREMQLQSYLHTLEAVRGSTVWDQLPLTTLRAILPPASDAVNEISLIVMLGDDMAPEYVLDALNGAVAAIVVIKHDSSLYGLLGGVNLFGSSLHEGMHIARTPDGQLPYLVCGNKAVNPLDPESTECIGQGIITAASSGVRRLCIKSPVSTAYLSVETAKGYKIALVLARQQGLWSTMESILAREQRSDRSESSSGGNMVAQERDYAESLSAVSDGQADPGWQGFFEEFRKTK